MSDELKEVTGRTCMEETRQRIKYICETRINQRSGEEIQDLMPNEIPPETVHVQSLLSPGLRQYEYDESILKGKLALVTGQRRSDLSALLHPPFPLQRSADTHRDLSAARLRSLGNFCPCPGKIFRCWDSFQAALGASRS